MPMKPGDIEDMIKAGSPGAKVTIRDLAGDGDDESRARRDADLAHGQGEEKGKTEAARPALKLASKQPT